MIALCLLLLKLPQAALPDYGVSRFSPPPPVEIGSTTQLFADDFLVATMTGGKGGYPSDPFALCNRRVVLS